MAGNGPPPKDPSKRARTNRDVVPLRILPIQATPQPELVSFTVSVERKNPDTDEYTVTQELFIWPAPTRNWWAMLEQHPLRHEFTDLDWSFLMETALIHARFWSGAITMASELRLREAKYGFTPEDRLRLRIQFAQAVEAEVATATKVSSARARFGRVESDLPDLPDVPELEA